MHDFLWLTACWPFGSGSLGRRDHGPGACRDIPSHMYQVSMLALHVMDRRVINESHVPQAHSGCEQFGCSHGEDTQGLFFLFVCHPHMFEHFQPLYVQPNRWTDYIYTVIIRLSR